MKLRKSTFLVVLLLGFAACSQGPSQYAESSIEIDLVKNGNAAYVKGDWDALRAMYADTAMVSVNTWNPSKFMPAGQWIDQLILDRQNNFPQVSIDDDAIYSMVVTDSGEKWVLNWLGWNGKIKSGTEVSNPVHIASQFAGGKIAFQVFMFDSHPSIMALTATDSTGME